MPTDADFKIAEHRCIRLKNSPKNFLAGDEDELLQTIINGAEGGADAFATLQVFVNRGAIVGATADEILTGLADAQDAAGDANDEDTTADTSDESKTTLPQDTPHRGYLASAEIMTVEDVLAHPDLSAIPYITDDRANDILTFLNNRANA